MTRVLVTDAGRGSAISIIRSLGQRGIHVIAADAKRRSPGFASRFAAESLLYPDAADQPDAAVDALLHAARERAVDLVIPVGEELVLLLSAARERFAGVSAVALPDREALAVTRDKLATVELARKLGVPTPRSALVATREEAVRHADGLGWPIVLKPQVSRRVRDAGRVDAFNVAYAADAAALEREMAAFEGRSPVLLQEYCPGEGHGIGLLMRDGEPLLAFQHRRIREMPITGGPSSLRESVRLDPTLFDYSVRLLGDLKWTGPAMVEFKVASDGARLMEINGRLWGSLPLAVKSGLDFPMRLVELFLSPLRTPDGGSFTYTLGVRSRDLTLELSWIASVFAARRRYPFLPFPTRREAVMAALRLFDPRDGFDIVSVHDPRPGLVEVVKIAVRAARLLTAALAAARSPSPGR